MATHAFFKSLVDHPHLTVEFSRDGNPFFRVTIKLDDTEKFRPFMEFLTVVEKARRVARHFGVDPLCSPATLSGEALDATETASDILFAGGHTYPDPDSRVSVTLPKPEAEKIGAASRELHELVLYTDENYEFPFMGVPLKLGRLAVCLTDVKIGLTDEEVANRICTAQATQVEIEYECTATTKHTIRRLLPEEVADATASTDLGPAG